MKTISEIAKEQGVTPNAVRAWIKKAGISPLVPGFGKPGKGRMYIISEDEEKNIIRYKEASNANR